MLTLNISAHVLHKAGTRTRHYEDAFAFDADAGRAAVADGASDAFEAGVWARLLVSTFVHAPPATDPAAFLDWLDGPARAWRATLNWYELPWYAEQKARNVGGLATLVGFCLNPDTGAGDAAGTDASSARWEALAVGDTCLLHLRGGAVLARFPVEDAAAFDTTPALLCSLPPHNKALLDDGGLRRCDGICRAGDVFLLATDALAQWLYRLADLDGPDQDSFGWESVLDVIEEDFEALIDGLRAESVIRNDDVTLLILRAVETPGAS